MNVCLFVKRNIIRFDEPTCNVNKNLSHSPYITRIYKYFVFLVLYFSTNTAIIVKS